MPGQAISLVSNQSDKCTTANITPELYTWGWSENIYDQNMNCDFTDEADDNVYRIGTTMKALDLSATPAIQGGDNVGHYVEHGEMNPEEFNYDDMFEQTYTVNGRKYHVSCAPSPY